MLAGHAAAYALEGKALVDGRHGWYLFTLENSAAAFFAIAAILVGCALLFAKQLKQANFQASIVQLFPRFAIAQIVLFSSVESAEGLHVTAWGVAAQLLTALCAAYLLSLFSRLLTACITTAEYLAECLERFADCRQLFVLRDPAPRSLTLSATAGSSRFQRPPPFA